MAEVTIRRLSKIADGSGIDVVVMDTLPYKETIRWTVICARDLNKAEMRIELLFYEGRTVYIIRSLQVTTNPDTLNMLGEIYAPGDFRVAARFLGATAGDTLELYAYGVVQREFPIE